MCVWLCIRVTRTSTTTTTHHGKSKTTYSSNFEQATNRCVLPHHHHRHTNVCVYSLFVSVWKNRKRYFCKCSCVVLRKIALCMLFSHYLIIYTYLVSIFPLSFFLCSFILLFAVRVSYNTIMQTFTHTHIVIFNFETNTENNEKVLCGNGWMLWENFV